MAAVASKHTQVLQPESQTKTLDLHGLSQIKDISARASKAVSMFPDRDIFSSQSDLDRALCHIASQGSMEDGPPSFPNSQSVAPPPIEYSVDPILLARFSTMLEQGLEKASKHITSDLKHEFQELGFRIVTIENTLEDTITRTNQNTECIKGIHK